MSLINYDAKELGNYKRFCTNLVTFWTNKSNRSGSVHLTV